jgi:hypothetical protein
MITRDLEMRRGDLKPDLKVDVIDELGLVNFTLATAVRMIGVLNGVVLFDRPATSTDLGVATMAWQTGDTDEPGTITVEVEAMWSGGKPQTFRTLNKVRVLPDLA